MADDANDVAEVTLDDFTADEQDTAAAPSAAKDDSKDDSKNEVVKDKDDDAKGDDTPAPSTASTDEPDKDDDKADDAEADTPEGEEDKPQGDDDKPLKPKSENRFQKLANENKTLREKVEQLTAEVYQPQSIEDLVEATNPDTGEAYTRAEARVVALEQKLEIESYNKRVVESQVDLGVQSQQVLTDFPVFNPSSEDFDQELASDAAELLEANLIRDDNVPELDIEGKPTGKGLIVGSNIAPYQLYKTLARAQGISVAKGQMKGQADAATMSANADTPASAAPPKKVKDPLLDLWSTEL